jgi:hypothetical protein
MICLPLGSAFAFILKIGKLLETEELILKVLMVRLIWSQQKEIEDMINKEKVWTE